MEQTLPCMENITGSFLRSMVCLAMAAATEKEVGTGWNVMKRFCQTICGSDRYHRKRAFFPGGMLPSTR